MGRWEVRDVSAVPNSPVIHTDLGTEDLEFWESGPARVTSQGQESRATGPGRRRDQEEVGISVELEDPRPGCVGEEYLPSEVWRAAPQGRPSLSRAGLPVRRGLGGPTGTTQPAASTAVPRRRSERTRGDWGGFC